ncbi:hypothetical protein [Streptomyces sp. ME19-01-6]|uniref:hypothetical protein n=1 Tax=Streptomyces sp. ME19-01-6 TaxID=3028686 RepID=UPI0029BA5C8A|nr:hypothetical protein [Streptomyces sp. ME19-01-6]MDX3227936.1 hypothetical protein [Streptomyces sp. ME19-01-6]
MGFLPYPREAAGRERTGGLRPATSAATTGQAAAQGRIDTDPAAAHRGAAYRSPYRFPLRAVARLTVLEYRGTEYGRGWMVGIRRECSYGYTGRCMFAIGHVDTFIRTPLEMPSDLSGNRSLAGENTQVEVSVT